MKFYIRLARMSQRISKKMCALRDEHHALPGNWRGAPRRRHHQILKQMRRLSAVQDRITEKFELATGERVREP